MTRRALLLLCLMLPGCGLRPAWCWQRFERCGNCGRVVDVREIRDGKCVQCEYGRRL